MLSFRKDDVSVLRAMSASEANAGNFTGAERLDSIANRLDTIMKRSSSRMTAIVMDPSERKPDSEEVNMWPYRSASLRSNGPDLWKISGDESPYTAARTLESFDGADGGAVWSVRVNQLQGSMCIGVTAIDVDLDSDWCSPSYRGQARPFPTSHAASHRF
jgi:hypothetical protein